MGVGVELGFYFLQKLISGVELSRYYDGKLSSTKKYFSIGENCREIINALGS